MIDSLAFGRGTCIGAVLPCALWVSRPSLLTARRYSIDYIYVVLFIISFVLVIHLGSFLDPHVSSLGRCVRSWDAILRLALIVCGGSVR